MAIRERTPSDKTPSSDIHRGASLVSTNVAIAGLSDLSAGAFLARHRKLFLAALGPSRGGPLSGARRPDSVLMSGGVGLAASCAGFAVYGFHAALAGPTSIDLTGLLATVAGLALVALAFGIALKGRPAGSYRRCSAFPPRSSSCSGASCAIVGAGLATNSGHPRIPSASTPGCPEHGTLEFEAGDADAARGVVRARANARRRRASPRLHGTRADTEGHLRMLVRAGFAVLAFDARGHGQSDGETNALGWRGASDVAGAVTFLRRQPHVDATRIAALGLSMGGEEASCGLPPPASHSRRSSPTAPELRRTATSASLPTASARRSHSSAAGSRCARVELLSGDDEPPPLKDIVGGIHVPVLLISSHRTRRPHDRQGLPRAHRRARSIWSLADTGHTRGLATHPAAYTSRATRFLRGTLRTQGGPANATIP